MTEINLTKRVKYAGDVFKELTEKAGFPIDLAADFLNNIPDADAVPVVHGRWKYIPPRVMECQDKPVLVYGSDKIVCTACGGKAISVDWLKFAYCPRCGSKMDGGAEG